MVFFASFLGLVFAAAGTALENLFDNPEFNDPKAVWTVCGKGKTERRETAPMSGEWIYRTTGDSYQFLRGCPRSYEPETEYTMEVKARSVNGKATLNILELFRRPDGKIGEGTPVAVKILLDEGFRTYRFPFVSSKHPIFSFMFYKCDPKSGIGGIDIASVGLYKGRLPTLEFRPLNRVGRKAPVPGTEVALPVNSFGRMKTPLRTLALVPRDRAIREVMEVFNGLNADVDVLVTTGEDQDIYETDSPRSTVENRLKNGEYGLFVVPFRTASRVGESLFKSVTNAVHAGAGLYLCDLPKPGRFATLLERMELNPSAAESLARAFPGGIAGPGDVSFDTSWLVEGTFGKGRVIVEKQRRQGFLKIGLNMWACGVSTFPFGRFADPYLARIFYRAAGMVDCGPLAVKKVKWLVVDATGTMRASGSAPDFESALAAAKAEPATSGKHLAAFRLLDSQGHVLDYDARVFERPGPRISALRTVNGSVSGDAPAIFEAETEDAGGCTLKWSMRDFSGRIIERGSAEPGKPFEVPSRRLYTNMGMVHLELLQGKTVRDVRTAPMYARDRDIARTSGDFTPSIWGARSSLSRDSFRQFERHLEDVGFRASVLPVEHSGYSQTLRNGMALGGDGVGDDHIFRPFRQKGDVHIGGLNTESGRERLRNYAAKEAKRASRYGVTQYMVTDEPNFTLRYTTDELDEHPENIAEYRRRMRKKYGDIAEFNRRHATSYASFDDLRTGRLAAARESGKFAEFVEWRNFNVDRWCEALKMVSDEVKSIDPTARIALANSFGQTALSANDYWKLLTRSGLEFSNEYTAMVYFRRDAIYNFDEFYRSFRPDMRLWGYVGYGMSKSQVRFMPWWFSAHRYGGFTWFSACGKDFRIFEQPSLAYTVDAADLKDVLESSRLMDGLGKLMLSAQWKKPDVAIYYSHESLLVSTLLGKETKSFEILDDGPVHDYMYSRQGAQYLVEDLLHQFDFVAPEQVVGGALKGYKALLMPRIKALSDAEAAALREFVSAGGRILADEAPGSYDELGLPRGVSPFRNGEVRLTGVNFDDRDSAQRLSMQRFLAEAGAKPVVACDGIAGRFGREVMRFECGTGDLFVFLRMPGRSNGKIKDVLHLPKSGYVYDSVGGKFLGRTDTVSAELDEGGAMAFSVLPVKPLGVKIAGLADEVRRGEDVRVALSLETPSGGAPDTVFNVRFISPSGACRFHMRRNVDAPGGRAEVVFPMAYNDTPGQWRVVVTDAMTALAAEKSFTLKQ